MAQASSAQREPSMEEILASIRRIIEDSDGGRKSFDGAAPAGAAEQPPPRAEVDVFRAELGPVAAGNGERRSQPPASAMRPEPAQVTEFAKPFRLAEVQAQVAREAAASAKAPEPERKPLMLADIQQQLARDAARPEAATPAPPPRPAPEAARPSAQTRPVVAATAEKSIAAAPAEMPAASWKREEPAQKPLAPAAPVPAGAVVQEATRQAIISPVAGRQVAAAFGELSEAFATRSKKTFDEMAEQMLRPMLQDWLDNNLPLLVERLVREEIERVARGS